MIRLNFHPKPILLCSRRRWAIAFLAFFLCLGQDAFAENLCSLRGFWDLQFGRGELTLQFPQRGAIHVKIDSSQQGRIVIDGNLDHLRTPFFEITSRISSTLKTVAATRKNTAFLKGVVKSQDTIVNQKPARELYGYFEIRDNQLFFNEMSWGGFIGNGSMSLVDPFVMDMVLAVRELSLDELKGPSQCPPQSNASLTGTVSGRIELNGTFHQLKLRGKLFFYNGSLKQTDFDHLTINFDGVYPLIDINDSMIVKKDGISVNIDGHLDLSNRCHILSGLSALKMSPIVEEKNSRQEWTIQRKADGQAASTDLKYRLNKKDASGAASNDEADMFSIEHNIKF